MRPMPPNTQYTAYGKRFILIGGHGRSSSSATTGGAGGGLGIATGSEGATIREERGSGEEGGAPADIGRGGRSTSGRPCRNRSREPPGRDREARARSCGREIEIEIRLRESKTLGIALGGDADADALQGFIARKMSFVASRILHAPGWWLLEAEGERAFFHYRLYPLSFYCPEDKS